ncbi:SREBP regulating gene protein-like [Frankliniella occidentalis]|uniref:SREBP regulating gene protein n=1 Tax=Frankliniella occidentalis TaxID=133901 RepID=A0A6J1RVS6_FRAOC|nr:SREBP regulating gene protein [Frankliniella occidentalis]XP_052130413.1 SREBP regulating gene protein-like [Frankliniella occidentalis]
MRAVENRDNLVCAHTSCERKGPVPLVWEDMWAAAILRIIRKRIVLGIIFLFSLTYCIVSFMKEGNSTTSYEIDTLPVRPLDRTFLWHSPKDDLNATEMKVLTCRNSVQGKVLIVDDRGYVCSRGNVLPSGCCNIEAENTKRYSCETCKESGCCSIYEYCISCCLHPDKKQVLQNVLGKASETLNVLFASVTDHFELCLAKCRTSSQSVQHENTYRDPKAKHCYGEIPTSGS